MGGGYFGMAQHCRLQKGFVDLGEDVLPSIYKARSAGEDVLPYLYWR